MTLKEKLIKYIEERIECPWGEYMEGYQDALKAILSFVTEYPDEAADAEKVKHGYWVQPNPLYNPFCSECKKYERSGEKKKYCSECGAKMDGKENEK